MPKNHDDDERDRPEEGVKPPYTGRKKVRGRPRILDAKIPPELLNLSWFREGLFEEIDAYASEKEQTTTVQGYHEIRNQICKYENDEYWVDPDHKREFLARLHARRAASLSLSAAKGHQGIMEVIPFS